ncbi:MAG TPA: helix-turn-helix domain-containing GNAT family N-acetyltransferase [Xanthobacteraceae bacterium]|nr:helix-turn-helix domain-containing GNAT family N-acetyltransferase [Xanthobacteraceae bacterium]
MAATAAVSPDIDQRVAAVRRFSRFYTRQIGLLQDGMLASPFSLAEARVLYELAQRQTTTASTLVAELGLDPGYLSRMLRGFSERRLIAKTAAPGDRRQARLSLTARGRKAYAPLEKGSNEVVARMLGALPAAEQDRVVAAMATVQRLIGGVERRSDYTLRPPGPGDLGWVVARHGVLYAQERGWGTRFEGLVAEIVAQFAASCDPARERCWIADIDGEPVGCVFVVKSSDDVAKLRLLLVEPRARGLGIGARLVDECVRFARAARYAKITLWTQSILVEAHRVYQGAGFKRVASEPHAEFGHALVGETWERAL